MGSLTFVSVSPGSLVHSAGGFSLHLISNFTRCGWLFLCLCIRFDFSERHSSNLTCLCVCRRRFFCGCFSSCKSRASHWMRWTRMATVPFMWPHSTASWAAYRYAGNQMITPTGRFCSLEDNAWIVSPLCIIVDRKEWYRPLCISRNPHK